MSTVTHSRAPAPPAARRHRPGWGLLWPLAMILVFIAIPFVLLLRASVSQLDPNAIEGSGFTLHAYGQLLQPVVVDAIGFSVMLAFIVASISLLVALPTAWSIAGMSRRGQVIWLIALLTTFALSEVLITFAWQILLSKKAGISNLAVLAGLLDKPVSLLPSFGGMVACITYMVIPFNILTLYPAMSRFDHSYLEAARTLGARPLRAFCSVLLPLIGKPLGAAYIMSLVFTLGSYVAPLVLGGPGNWTIGVVISETAMSGHNMPMAAAISVLLLAVTLLLIGGVVKFSAKGEAV
ncbi:ABC transporter permease [Sodalis sp. RH21]|uniref:ABC transporter permease n=1 Tax=unclassified Sodalis (in: enterobacteria) TaxID=2636512 RepID=UPI0039B6CC9C